VFPPSISDPGQVRGRVDVVRTAGVAAFDEGDELGPGSQERAGTLIAGGGLDHLGPVLPGQQHRVARLPVVGGDRHAGAAAVRGDQAGDRLGSDQRLVGQRDHDRAGVRTDFQADVRVAGRFGEGLQGGTQRGAHAGAPLRIVDGQGSVKLEGDGTGDDQDRVGAASPKQVDAALGESLAVQLHQRLGLAEPGPFPRSEQDPRDRRPHGVQAYRVRRRPADAVGARRAGRKPR
jgi:hypothetical protein